MGKMTTPTTCLPSTSKPPLHPGAPGHPHRHHQLIQTKEENHRPCHAQQNHIQEENHHLLRQEEEPDREGNRVKPELHLQQRQKCEHPLTRKQQRRSSTSELEIPSPPPLPPPPPPPPAAARLPLLPPPRRTNPLVWCIAVCCLVLAIIVFFSAIATVVLFLAIRPRLPSVDVTNATLESLYLDSTALLNGELILIVNISNPNNRLDINFEILSLQLAVGGTPVAAQTIEPFRAQRSGWTAFSVHFTTSQVALRPNDAMAVRQMVAGEKVSYVLTTTIRTKAVLGPAHLSYWLYGLCSLVVTGPPNGVLVNRSCRTKR